MALTLETLDTIRVISRRDASVTCEENAYHEYAKNLDESLLELNPEMQPTRFVMRKVLPYAARQKIKNEQISYKGADNVEIKMGFVLEEVRAALVDIENPGNDKLKYKKDNDNLTSKELVALLDAYGIVDELYLAYQNSAKSHEFNKKK